MDFFTKRNALLVTKHNKGSVIVPLLEQAFDMEILVTTQIDTDQFGTFSGETERPDTQINTLKMKVLKGLALFPDHDMAIASEGSFTPHPDCPLIPVNTEMVMLIDRQYELEITGKYIDLAAKVKEVSVRSLHQALDFAQAVGFPNYGVILKTLTGEERKQVVFKDAATLNSLEAAILYFLKISVDGAITIQTDMRAHKNPNRMENIRMATINLIENMRSLCPHCQLPGFSPVELVSGLPCSQCGGPTGTTMIHRNKCKNCDYTQDKIFPNGKHQEDPALCEHCNP